MTDVALYNSDTPWLFYLQSQIDMVQIGLSPFDMHTTVDAYQPCDAIVYFIISYQ